MTWRLLLLLLLIIIIIIIIIITITIIINFPFYNWGYLWLLTRLSYHFSAETFSTVTASFYFDRRIGYFLIQVYFPDIFVVILSWIVFWMEVDDIGNRMALGITTILTIMFLLGSLNGNLPKVSYPKALDWYLLVSFIFVFLSLIEAIIVFIICQKAKSYREKAIKFEVIEKCRLIRIK